MSASATLLSVADGGVHLNATEINRFCYYADNVTDLCLSSPWWGLIIAEECGWDRRASRMSKAMSVQSNAFFDMATDIETWFCEDSIIATVKSCVYELRLTASLLRDMSMHLAYIISETEKAHKLYSYVSPRTSSTMNQLFRDLEAFALQRSHTSAELWVSIYPRLRGAIENGIGH